MSEQSGDVKVLLEQITKALVDAPDQVSVNPVEEGGETILELTVGPNDLGKVIGKSGRTARALRTLLSAAGIKAHKRYTLEILE
ncbi:MAG TPA: KH domain-containing protein [Terriglobales bacterium]|nr:KH domain-containing protein [Terriglobales bacterium]